MPTIHTDADLSPLAGKTIAILGYGSQGHAHALNLRDSGLKVLVGLYEGSRSWARAEAAGLEVATVAHAASRADLIMMLLPDTAQAACYKEHVAPHLSPGKMLLFAHGFNIHYHQIQPPDGVDVALVAPKAPGHRMREVFTTGAGVPALLAIHKDATGRGKPTALAYAKGIGATRAGVIETTFPLSAGQSRSKQRPIGDGTPGPITRALQDAFKQATSGGGSG